MQFSVPGPRPNLLRKPLRLSQRDHQPKTESRCTKHSAHLHGGHGNELRLKRRRPLVGAPVCSAMALCWMKGCSYANVVSPFLNIHVSGRLWLWLPWSKMSSHQGMPTSFTFWNLHAHQNFEPSELWQRWADHLSCPVLQPWSYSSLGLDAFEMTWWAPHKGWTTCTSTSCKFRNSGKIWQDYMSWDNTHDWLPSCLMCNDLSSWFGSRAAKPVKRMGKPELIIPGIEASSKKRKLKKMHAPGAATEGLKNTQTWSHRK